MISKTSAFEAKKVLFCFLIVELGRLEKNSFRFSKNKFQKESRFQISLFHNLHSQIHEFPSKDGGGLNPGRQKTRAGIICKSNPLGYNSRKKGHVARKT